MTIKHSYEPAPCLPEYSVQLHMYLGPFMLSQLITAPATFKCVIYCDLTLNDPMGSTNGNADTTCYRTERSKDFRNIHFQKAKWVL